MARFIWTKELVTAEALKYQGRKAFQKGSRSAYGKAYRNGWLDEVCSHMKPMRISWTKEMVAQEALKYQTRYEFKNGSANAYVKALAEGWLDEVCGHMEARFAWTKELVTAEALKYQTRAEFLKGSHGAYEKSRIEGWLDEVCGHMVRKIKWTKELVAEEALKYQTRGEFCKGSRGAYNKAMIEGWLDDVCSHMVPGVKGGSSDNDAVYIWKALGEEFNGKPVYKIGITSARLEDVRINKVANASGFQAEIVILKKVDTAATSLEAEIHGLGEHPGYEGFDGYSEFRAMNDDELALAVSFIEDYAMSMAA